MFSSDRRNTSDALCLLALLATLAVNPSSALAEDTLVRLDGSSIEADVQRIDDAGQVYHGDKRVSLQALRRIDTAAKAGKPTTKPRVYLLDGSVLLADKLIFDSGTLTLDWTAGKATQLPVASVRAVQLGVEVNQDGVVVTDSAFAAAIDDQTDNRDALFVRRDDKLTEVRGVIESLGKREAAFFWNDKPRKIDRKNIYGLVFAVTAGRPDLTGAARAALTDGSAVWGRAKSLDGKVLTLERDDGVTLAIPWNKVTRLDVRSERMVFLSDLEPINARSEGIATLPTWPIQRDRSVMGNPITLGGRTYDKGLGTHAAARIEYAAGRYDVFAAMIGIDAHTAGRGDCVFVVLADGREKLRQRMTGKDKPREIRVDIAGADRLTLLVEPGEDLDIADHADWADARLIRERN